MRKLMIMHFAGLLLGVMLDFLIGDPKALPHPVKGIGKLISFLEKKLYKNEKKRGAILWCIVVLTVFSVTGFIMGIAHRLGPVAAVLMEAVITCYCLAARSLCTESMKVQERLSAHDTEGAREALSMIVGRDTENLTEEEMIKAAVETVAENASDGVIAPFFYMILGGPALGMVYKAINTMDSMLGYRNDKYMNFGYFAAKADDAANFLPSRISALAMIGGCYILGLSSPAYNGKEALRIWRRDRRNHLSPNSAQTESACAGALGLMLGGPHTYQGVTVPKDTIGDEKRKPEVMDIKRANRLMFMAEAVVVVIALLYALPAL